MVPLYAKVFRQLALTPSGDTIRVLFVCKTGRRRSVAGATLLHKLLERAGVRVSAIHRTVERS